MVWLQIQQATQLTQVQIESDANSQFLEQYHVLQGESPTDTLAKAVEDPESITTSELLILEAFINRYLDFFLGLKSLADLGIVDESRWRDQMEFAARSGQDSYFTYVFGNQVSQAYWDVARENSGWQADQEFFVVVDETIRSVDPNALKKWHSRIRSNLKERLEND